MGSTVLAGLVGILVGAALLGGALLALQARRVLWVVVVVAALLGFTTLAGLIWAVVVSGSLLIAALAVGAAIGSSCGVSVVVSLLISARLLGDLHQAARILAGRAPYPKPPAGVSSGYPGGYSSGAPSAYSGRIRAGAPNRWEDPHAAERRW